VIDTSAQARPALWAKLGLLGHFRRRVDALLNDATIGDTVEGAAVSATFHGRIGASQWYEKHNMTRGSRKAGGSPTRP